MVPRGFVTLDFGGRWQFVDDPQLQQRQRRNGSFEFDQQISMNVVGKVGEKLQVTANFDNNNSFDFENDLKVEYTGFEEDILQKLEIGNVSLPLNNSLITGAQNLFGIKAQLQFGHLYVTTVASTQRGKTESIEIEGGGVQGREFELLASNYDENRHFFLGHFFRDNYEKWLQTIPNVNSGVNIKRVEVYVVNRNNDTQTLRDVVGLMDLGEAEERNIYRNFVNTTPPPGNANANEANDLFAELITIQDRSSVNIGGKLENLYASGKLEDGLDYEKITSARKLGDQEYTFNKRLGYITLSRKLQNDEALAVAYEYTYNGADYQVGELSEDYTNLNEDEVVFLKLLRPRKINIFDQDNERIPTWDLMMKNIYNLNATNVNPEGFQLRVIYRDDRSGIDNPQLQEGSTASTKPLIQILGLDRLNPNNDQQMDGNFDFVEDLTINTETGLIIFPFLQPFSDPLRQEFQGDAREDALIDKYVYDELYNRTKADAELVASKNKYFITGFVQAGSSSEIVIPGFNIAEGSVRVFAGGSPLQEGTDYQVDYNFGRVNIINEGVLNSGKKITISYEKADLFNFQSRTLLGTRFDYRLNEDVNFGATLLHLNERPLISRISVGNEPTRNTKYGFDVNIRKESRFLTKMLDKLPLIQTKEPSSITFNAEFAQLIPGTSNIVDGEGTSYIDDFENTATPFSLNNPLNWRLAATPETENDRFYGAQTIRKSTARRAKLAWYQVDNLFYREDRRKPDNITEEELENHYVRRIRPQEIFKNLDQNVINFQQIFDMAYFPEERGQYNYNENLNLDGTLPNPRQNWAGITTAIRSEVDFDKSNVEYIEFWLMDPFIDGPNGQIKVGNETTTNSTGGDLFFNLGSVSEDVMPDSRHAFENGLPPDGNLATSSAVTLNEWGYVTTQQFITDAFDNDPASRPNQDVGLDGASDDIENDIFSDFINTNQNVQEDPSADNFRYFLSSTYDQNDAGIIERYRDFNGMEGNSPVSTGDISQSATNVPDNEDLNRDNTLSELEEYYEYKVPLRPNQLAQNKYVVDQVSNEVNGDNVTWYLFRIPVRNPDGKFGNINGFKSIKYLRMYMTNFSQPVVLRMTNFRFVASRWRRNLTSLDDPTLTDNLETDDFNDFTVSVVNVEENGTVSENAPAYNLPPGLDRDRDNTSSVERRLNEQSVQLCVDDLEDGKARAIVKQVNVDLINYGRIKMFLHAHGDVEDDEMTAFLRLGTDVDSNYYEIEVPLKITDINVTDRRDLWPLENEIDLDLDELYGLKSERDRLNIPKSTVFPDTTGGKQVGNQRIRVKGNPDLSSVQWLTIGLRNPRDNGLRQSVCLWANELRVTDFDRTKGWAANATLNAKLADFANVTASARHTTFGFGGIQSKIAERTREETTSYDVSANVAVDKLLPEQLGLKVPMYVSYEKTTIKPRFDPANPDITLDAALLNRPENQREEYEDRVIDETTRKSINFTNVRKEKTKPDAKKHIYDIENLSFTYAYSEVLRTNFNLQQYSKRTYNAAVAYNYSPTNEGWSPFSEWKTFNSPWLQLIKDFNINPIPTNIGIRADLRRQLVTTVYRNDESLNVNNQSNFEKYFTLDRNYNLRWDLTNNLLIDYNARANAIIDEPNSNPEGGFNENKVFVSKEEYNDSIWTNLKNLGRMKNFDQSLSANYRLPLDKLPITNWLNSDYRYQASYSWQAGPLFNENNDSDIDLDFGNIIQNSRDNTVNGKVDLVKLYNKINFLKEINTPARNSRVSSLRRPAKADTVQTKPDNKGLKGVARFLMSLRSINASYTLREGTLLPGFTPRAYLFGLDSSFNAPGIPFLLGSQDPDIRLDLAQDGLIIKNPNLTTPFTQTRTVDYNLRADVEPFKDFKVQLNMKKTKSTSFEEIFRFNEGDNQFESLSPARSGGYAVSFLSIATAFEKTGDNNESEAFGTFENNRFDILNRFRQETGIEYDSNSQDVVIPAFIAAYTGKSVNDVSLSPFPSTPLPNWRVDYTGLGKIPKLKEVFQSISLTHGYNSNYSVLSYTNANEYNDGLGLENNIEDYNESYFGTLNGQNIPTYVISQVTISEQFAPLIGVNVRTNDRVSIKVEYKTQRDLALNITNSQVTEVKSNDLVIGVDFTKANFKLPFKSQGRVITLKNDLTFRMNFTIRDTETIQRRIDELATVTNGSLNIQIRPNISYVLNEKLNLQFYFERNINEPSISISPRRATTRAGFQVRFSLAQ
ncbi:cell surface protein SprA [Fulvivirga aurantia]|uniref:T9SS outer membrane translocon Sov/SprA n=1 Tax=Fulvivirga aurantia TaxID=2529383 RepID=UPI0031B57115